MPSRCVVFFSPLLSFLPFHALLLIQSPSVTDQHSLQTGKRHLCAMIACLFPLIGTVVLHVVPRSNQGGSLAGLYSASLSLSTLASPLRCLLHLARLQSSIATGYALPSSPLNAFFLLHLLRRSPPLRHTDHVLLTQGPYTTVQTISYANTGASSFRFLSLFRADSSSRCRRIHEEDRYARRSVRRVQRRLLDRVRCSSLSPFSPPFRQRFLTVFPPIVLNASSLLKRLAIVPEWQQC